MSDNIVVLSDENFHDEVIGEDGVIMVDFWADWCAPCKNMFPVIQAIANKYEGKIKVCKASTDNCSSAVSKYGVQSLPTLLFVKNGSVESRHVGVILTKDLERKIEELLK
jgi:thioredoxin 1